ncbi:hypothetical protein BDV97DRAFT_400952 [Delphinella strobiligena]|nr:hypothetical protein BDV97DRAFT_400952 [Delphinella strobiligena]
MEPPSQPGSPAARLTQRQSGSSIRSPRSTSRMSVASSRQSISGPIAATATPRAPSRASDDDAKTAVKVAIRVRPPLKATDPGFDLIPQRFRGSTCEVPSPSNLIVASPQGKKLFVFDKVFDENTTQEGVWNYLSDSVNSFVQGYNVSILAYGQSGSGKSYSMGTGGLDQMLDSSHAGVIPRAGQAIFEKLHGPSQPKTGLKSPHRYSTQGIQGLKKQPSADTDWELRATYVEIYNEHLHDLLVPESVPQAERAQVSIREDTKGRILLTGLVQHPIKSVDDLLHVLEFGSAIRQTDATAINAKSSRSHAVFSLNLVQRNKTSPRDRRLSVPLEAMSNVESNVTIDSKLHFVDLAGSERLKNTGAQGERAKEGISINAGLASLGKVISQLSSKQAGGYISYRDSRLTRLLQDSLGGTAITYMLACVTPAEFHLSETLNTVTYAQRARAIQSKPEIQHTQEDKDSPARIERLQAEVSFLREQIKRERSSEKVRPSSNGNRLDERREAELQNQLMDMQESYNALSQRHARLIAEISRAREQPDEDMPTVREVIGDRAVERLKRSNSLSEAVEQVVEEYEKTIQSLESSLCNTRSSLSNTESTLMERESKIAYMESLAQQLQARLHKAADRENNNDAYLRDLETQIENTTTSEEKSTSLIASLRKELARVKENETNSEEYITELEGRLAEAEQEQEIMKREIDRLENVIQRQRSIGRLDNLLSELDGIKQTEIDAKIAREKQINGHVKEDSAHEEEAVVALNKVHDGEAEPVEEPEAPPEGEVVPEEVAEKIVPANSHPSIAVQQPTRPQSRDEQQAAQSNFMADKLETTMQELFDLRSEHEAAMSEKEDLQRKYEHVLEALAKLQEGEQQKPAESSREQSFLEHAGVNTMVDGQEPTSSSRSLESELSSSLLGTSTLAEELNKSTETSTEDDFDDDTEDTSFAIDSSGPQDSGEAILREEDGSLADEIESLRKKHLEQQERVKELTATYAELQQNHEATLGQLDSAKAEVTRVQNSLRPASPGMRSPTLRRKLSQDLMSSMGNTDRATRSFASLRNIALDNFESNIDVRQNFELNLNTIMTELHDRTQKVEALDAEFQKSKKEIDNKQQIILGLTRERKSLHASTNVDITVVGQMQNQLEQSEQELRSLQEAHTTKEQEWQKKYHELTRQLEEHRAAVSEKPAANDGEVEQAKAGEEDPASEHLSQVARLEKELAGWEVKHNDALSNMKASEAALLATIATLEASTTEIENVAQEINERHAAAKSSFEQERIKHQEIVADLQMEIDEHRSASEKHAKQLSKLEYSHAAILKQVDEDSKTKELTQKELETHRGLVSNLESQLDSHKATIAVHEANLETLLENMKAAHAEEIARIKEDAAIAAEREASDKHAGLTEEHEAAMRDLEEQHKTALSLLQQELERRKEDIEELLSGASALLGHETDVGRFHGHLSEALVREGNSNTDEWKQKHAQVVGEKETLQRDREAIQQELSTTLAKCADLEDRVGELMVLNSEAMQKLEQTTQNELKSSRLVQELEEQLTSNYDEHEAAKNRLSSMTERQMQLEEAYHAKSEMDKELEDARLKISLLESQLTDLRRRSLQSPSRDSINRDSGLAPPAAPSFNRDSLSPEAAAIALARVSSYEPAYNSPMLRSTPTSAPSSALPSPPPAIPLPPLPNSPPLANPMLNGGIDARTRSDSPSNGNKSKSPPGTPSHGHPPASMWTTLPQPPASSNSGNSTFSSALPDPALAAKIEEQESRIRTIEKHLFAEKQLTATLEEALVDLENSQNKSKQDTDAWRKKCKELEDELVGLRKEKSSNRASLQQVEEEREMRVRAERARMALEERMKELNTKDGKKKKKGALNCF